jgi:hypothetical protein
MLAHSFHRIAGLREALRRVARPGELHDLLDHLDDWFTTKSFERLRAGVGTHDSGEVRRFLDSLRPVADDYALAVVNVDSIHAQFRSSSR